MKASHNKTERAMVRLGQILTAVAATAVLIACSSTSPEGDLVVSAPDRDGTVELREARDRWDAAGVDDYQLTVDMECFCPVLGPTVVDVKDGVASIVGIPEDAAQDDVDTLPLTVDDAFDELDRFVDADRFDVAYHQELGYPISANIDPVAGTADDEFRLHLVVEVP